MKKWKIEIELSVAQSWIDDGFNAEHPVVVAKIKESIQGLLTYAYEHEIKVDVKVTPV